MTTARSAFLPRDDTVVAGQGGPIVEIVVPVYNEEASLERSIRRLHLFLQDSFPFAARVTIADNASTDATWAIATNLATTLSGVAATHLDAKGRGRALSHVWSGSAAEVLVYMDVDLSTDLAALLPLVAPLLSGHSDLAIGTRLHHGSRVQRGAKREVISRCYNRLLRTTLVTTFSDAQCGFKAIRADRARQLLPLVQDTGWFFDTELLVLAERRGLRIHEVPVDWIDDPDSRVDIVSTAVADIKGVLRLVTRGAFRAPGPALDHDARLSTGFPLQVARFGAVGVVSTLAYLLLFLVLRSMVTAQLANALALVTTAVANTAANRHFTFFVRGAHRFLRHQLQGLVVLAITLAVTSSCLLAMRTALPHGHRPLELAALIGGNLLATVVRFVLFRSWVFRAYRTPPTASSESRTGAVAFR